MNIAKSIAVQDFIHFILIFWIPWVGVRIPCTTSSLEEVMPTWERQRHQGPFLHLGHHALNILVRILREFWWWWLVLQVIIIKIHAVFTRSHPNGEISLSAYGEVLPHWTLDGDVFQSRVLSGNVLEKFGWLVMVGLYDHQLLVWPRLIQKTSPQLRMKARTRRCCRGHYGDPPTHFSTSLSQLLPGNPIDSFQFDLQWYFCGGYSLTHRLTHRLHNLHRLHRLHQSHQVSYRPKTWRRLGGKRRCRQFSADVFWIGSDWCGDF